jgi:hypothetical protein
MTHEDKVHRESSDHQRRQTSDGLADFDVTTNFTPDVEKELRLLFHRITMKYDG